jgi:hypothetical protein
MNGGEGAGIGQDLRQRTRDERRHVEHDKYRHGEICWELADDLLQSFDSAGRGAQDDATFIGSHGVI